MLRRAGVSGPQTRIRSAGPYSTWNNARLNTISSYYTLVPGFERLLKEHGGDLESFHRAVERMRKLSPEARWKALDTGN